MQCVESDKDVDKRRPYLPLRDSGSGNGVLQAVHTTCNNSLDLAMSHDYFSHDSLAASIPLSSMSSPYSNNSLPIISFMDMTFHFVPL